MYVLLSPATQKMDIYISKVVDTIKTYQEEEKPIEKEFHFTNLLLTYIKNRHCTLELVEILCKGGANIRETERWDKGCALTQAIMNGLNKEIIQYLIGMGGADDSHEDNIFGAHYFDIDTLTPLEAALRTLDPELTMQLTAHQLRTNILHIFNAAMYHRFFPVALRLYVLHREYFLNEEREIFFRELKYYFSKSVVAVHINNPGYRDLLQLCANDGCAEAKEWCRSNSMGTLAEIARTKVRRHLLLVAAETAKNGLIPPKFQSQCAVLYETGQLPPDLLERA